MEIAFTGFRVQQKISTLPTPKASGWPPTPSLQAQSRGWSIDGLQQAIGVAAELNADVKGVAASADYALERAVRRIVTIRAETGRGGRAPYAGR